MRARVAAYAPLVPDGLRESVDDRERRWRARLARPEGRCWLAEEAGILIGFAYTAPSADEGAESACAELYALYLLPDAVGRGLGRQLMDRALEELRGRGFAEVVLWFAEENARAARFYASAGFALDERAQPLPLGDTGLTKRRLRRALP